MPTRGEFSKLGVLALLRCQHLLGWDCVLPRKAATHSGCLISTGTSCGPASSAGLIPGPLRGCLAAQETNPGQHHGWGWSTPGEFYSLHTSQGALGALLGISSRDEPSLGRGLLPRRGERWPAHTRQAAHSTVSVPATAARGRPGWPHATRCDLGQALGSSSSAYFPPGAPVVTGLCPSCAAPLHGSVGAERGHPAQCAQCSLGSILLFMETQTWCPRAHPVQGGGIRSLGQVCHPRCPPPTSTPCLQGAWVPMGQKSSGCPGVPPPPAWASGCRVGPQEEGRASGGKPPRQAECDSAEMGRRREGKRGDRHLWRPALPPSLGPSPAPLEQGASLRVLSWETGGQGH